MNAWAWFRLIQRPKSYAKAAVQPVGGGLAQRERSDCSRALTEPDEGAVKSLCAVVRPLK